MVITELLNDFRKAKASQVELDKLLFTRRHPVYKRFHACASFLHLREWLDHGGQTTVYRANFCMQHKLCRVCAIRRAARLCEAYETKVNQVLEEARNKNLIPCMLTFTVKNGHDLVDTLNHLQMNYRAMWERSRKERKRGWRSALCPVVGGVWSTEIKRGRNSKLWHPHLHIFTLCEAVPNQSALRKEWLELTGDSTEMKVSICKNGNLKGLIEVLKYITKFSECSPMDALTIFESTRKARLCAPFGILRGVKVPESLEDADLDGEYVDYIAHFLYRSGRYKLSTMDDNESKFKEVRERLAKNNYDNEY